MAQKERSSLDVRKLRALGPRVHGAPFHDGRSMRLADADADEAAKQEER